MLLERTKMKTSKDNTMKVLLIFLAISLFLIPFSLAKSIEKENLEDDKERSNAFTFSLTSSNLPQSSVRVSDYNEIKDLSPNILATTSGAYQTDLFTGTASYSYEIRVPPGRNGLKPQLFINYNHHQTFLKSELGNAWTLLKNYIYRDINGTLEDISDDFFRLHFNGLDTKLVYIPSENRYHTEIEAFWKIERKNGGDNDKKEYWTLKTKDGTTYRFGYNKNSEFASNQENFTSIWSLDLIKDTHNNKIEYFYNENLNSDYYPYLNTIIYNDGTNQIIFDYVEKAFNGFNGYKYGTQIRQNALLKNIKIKNNKSLVRKYELKYETINNKKFLKKITEFGEDNSSFLPPTTFFYNQPEKGWEISSSYSLPEEICFGNEKDNGVRLVDINGDGFDDLIRMNGIDNMEYWLNNKINGWESKKIFENLFDGGIVNNGTDVGVRFFDINGDMKIDIIKLLRNKIPIVNHEDKFLKKVLINSGSGWKEKNISLPENISFVSKLVCIPDYCSEEYTDGGISCEGGVCKRNCYIEQFYDPIVSENPQSDSKLDIFSATEAPKIKNATLYVYQYWTDKLNFSNPLEVYETSTNWSEKGMSWDNQPNEISFVNNFSNLNPFDGWIAVDITNATKNKEEISLKLRFRDEKEIGDNSIIVSSKEYGYVLEPEYRSADPYIKIEYTDNSAKEIFVVEDVEATEGSNTGRNLPDMYIKNQIGSRSYVYLKFNSLQYCKPDCIGKVCGPDGCGGYCGICPTYSPYCFNEGTACGTAGPCSPTNYSTCCYCAQPFATIDCNECLIGYYNTWWECEDGEEKCEGEDYYLCENKYWVNKGKIVGKCGYLPEDTKVYFRTSDLGYSSGWVSFGGRGFCYRSTASSCWGANCKEIKNFPNKGTHYDENGIRREKYLACFDEERNRLCVQYTWYNSWGNPLGTSGRIHTPCTSAITDLSPTEPYKSEGKEVYGDHCGDGIYLEGEIDECPYAFVNYTYDNQFCNYDPADYEDSGVRLADINNDGEIDFIKATQEERRVWLKKDGRYVLDNNWQIPEEAYFVKKKDIYTIDAGLRIADVNGDGFPDLIKGDGITRITWINTGESFEKDDRWKIPEGIDFTSNGNDEGAILIDVDGDGLIDILKANPLTKKIWINTGNGWEENSNWKVPKDLNLVGFSSRVADLNGDGLPDFMKAGSSLERKVWINRGKEPYLLKKIINEYGGNIVINYKKISFFNNTGNDNINDLQLKGWVVSSIAKDNGLEGNHKIISTVNYTYTGGYYDPKNREFRGFNHVEEILSDGSIVKHYFHQDKAKKGLEYESIIFDKNNNPYLKLQNEWTSEDNGEYYVIKLISKKEYTYDSVNNPKIIQTKYKYDGYGNIIKISYLGDVSKINDEKYLYNEYLYNEESWIIDKIKHTYLLNYNSTKVSEIWFRYDNLPYNSLPVKGDLTYREYWLNTGSNPKERYEYDSYGNVIKYIDPKGHNTTYFYEPTHTFPVKKINAKNQAFNYEYDLGTGNLNSKIDPNGFKVSYEYDAFGRIIKEILPYDSKFYPTIQIEYLFDGILPEEIKIRRREENGTTKTYDTYYYFDGFGNLVQKKSESENSSFITEELYYDEKGRIKQKILPYYTANNKFSINTSDEASRPSIKYFYDTLDRLVKIINPDDTEININYDPQSISIYDENNNRKDYLQDAYGNIIEVKEHNMGEEYVTKYKYDALGNLIEIRDAENNTIRYYYDSLGRKIKLEDPDLGNWTYEYDSVGNLIAQRDNKNNTISFKYDTLNRVIKKSTERQTTYYKYDEKTIGVLTSVQNNLLVIRYAYDSRLRKIGEEKIIDGVSFTTRFYYDDLDRIKMIILPNGENITYGYNNQGRLNSINGIILDIDYNALGLPVLKYYANNLQTKLTYDPKNFRLVSIKTSKKQDLNYAYDNVGNIMQIKDSIHNSISIFCYDNLNRLIRAYRTGLSNSKYNFTYVYSSIGNLKKIIGENYQINFIYSNKPIHMPVQVQYNSYSKTLQGDINRDCKVDIFDLASVGLAYGSRPEDANWNENADVNNDGKVDIFDLATVGLNYGEEC